MPMIFFYFLKIIFNISTSKRSKKYKPYSILAKKNQNLTKYRLKHTARQSLCSPATPENLTPNVRITPGSMMSASSSLQSTISADESRQAKRKLYFETDDVQTMFYPDCVMFEFLVLRNRENN
jgi:hypothetical protein